MSSVAYPVRTVSNMQEKADSQLVPWSRHNDIKDVRGITNMADAIEKSGLAWEVEKVPTYLRLPGSDNWTESGSYSVVRKTDGKILAPSVGPEYKPVQNLERFDWFQAYLDSGMVNLTHAGSIREGEKTVIISRLNTENREIVQGDEIAKYLLIRDAFDGKSALSVFLMAVRLVCGNGAIASSQVGRWSIKHNSRVNLRMELIKDNVHEADDKLMTFTESYKLLASKALPRAEVVRDYIKQVFGLEEKEDKRGVKRLSDKAEGIISRVERAMETGPGSDIPGVRGTWWGLYNAVTEYNNHERGHSVDTRLDGLWFGTGAKSNNEALTLALQSA